MQPATGPFGNPLHGWDYYVKCMIGGILACGTTHTTVVPLDVVKCRMQTSPAEYTSMMIGLRAARTSNALTLGWLPTLLGYSAQGLCKFGFYEIFKDVFLAPFEAAKVRMQTSLPAAAFPTSFGPAVRAITSREGAYGLYKGLVPLWGRQIPYTVVKFVAFERIVEAFYRYIFTRPKQAYSKAQQLSITFASGYLAGILCAIVSQPADTVVSQLNQSPGASLGQVVSKVGGVKGLYRGLSMRIVMIGTLTGLQWWLYDSFKTATGLQTSGGASAAAAAGAAESGTSIGKR